MSDKQFRWNPIKGRWACSLACDWADAADQCADCREKNGVNAAGLYIEPVEPPAPLGELAMSTDENGATVLRRQPVEPAPEVPPHTCMGGDPGSGLNGPCRACEQDQAQPSRLQEIQRSYGVNTLSAMRISARLKRAENERDAALARAEQAEKDAATPRGDGHNTCREVEQRLRVANRRLQQEGPALERDKVIMALRERLERAERLIQQVEWAGRLISGSYACPWCERPSPTGHARTCPAFGSQTSPEPREP